MAAHGILARVALSALLALPLPAAQPLVWEAASQAHTLLVQGANTMSEAWFTAYTTSRMVAVAPAEREPTLFGPWTAPEDFGAADARDDGSITEWASHYYITHDWSDYGQQILTMVPGDWVSVNGREIQVQGTFNYPKDSYYDEIMQLVGSGTTVLQTCHPDSDYNRIVYGW